MGIKYNKKSKILEFIQYSLRLISGSDGNALERGKPLELDSSGNVVVSSTKIYKTTKYINPINGNNFNNFTEIGTTYRSNSTSNAGFINGPVVEENAVYHICGWELEVDNIFGGEINNNGGYINGINGTESVFRQTLTMLCYNPSEKLMYPIICIRFNIGGRWGNWTQLAMVDRGSGTRYQNYEL